MNTSELKEMIDGSIFDVPQGDCYLAMVKVGNEASISFEGESDLLKVTLLGLMKKYKDLAEIILDAAEAYEMEE